MSKRFNCEDEPNEHMEMPCRCDCGKWFDLHDGYRSRGNKVVCGDCHEVDEKIEDLRKQYDELEYSEKPHKREKAKIVKELQKLGAELHEY